MGRRLGGLVGLTAGGIALVAAGLVVTERADAPARGPVAVDEAAVVAPAEVVSPPAPAADPEPVAGEPLDAEARLAADVAEYMRLAHADAGGDGGVGRDEAALEAARARVIAAGEAAYPLLFAQPSDSWAWHEVFDWKRGVFARRTPPLDRICARLLDDVKGESLYRTEALIYLDNSGANTWAEDPEATLVLTTLARLLGPERGLGEDDREHVFDLLVTHGRRGPSHVAAAVVGEVFRRLESSPEAGWEAAQELAVWGADVSHVLPALLSRWDEFVEGDRWSLRGDSALFDASAGTVPEALPHVLALLNTPGRGVGVRNARVSAADTLRGWGETATPAVPALRRLFDTAEDGETRTAVALTLAALGVIDDDIRRAVLASGEHEIAALSDDLRVNGERYLPWLSPEEWLYDKLLDRRPDLAVRVAEQFARHPDPDEAYYALRLFEERELATLPPSYVEYLEDATRSGSTWSRVWAVDRLIQLDSPRRELIVHALKELRSHTDPEVRQEAAHMWGLVHDEAGAGDGSSGETPRPAAELVALLEAEADEGHVWAQSHLFPELLATEGELPELSAELLLGLLAEGSAEGLQIVRRSPAHGEVLARGLDGLLKDELALTDRWNELRGVLAELGPAAEPHFEGIRQRATTLDKWAERRVKTELDALVSAAEGDAVGFAAHTRTDRTATLQRVIEQGDFDAVLVYLGRSSALDITALRGHEEAVGWAVRRAVEAAPEVAHDDDRREGAAYVLDLLAPSQAWAEARVLLGDTRSWIRRTAAYALVRLCDGHDVDLPPDIVQRMSADPATHHAFLRYLAKREPTSRVAEAGLSSVLRHGSEPERLRAARIQVERGGSTSEAARVVREVLAARRRRPFLDSGGPDDWEGIAGPPWPAAPYCEDFYRGAWVHYWSEDVAAVLGAVEPEVGDLELILGVVPPGRPETLLPLLERLGPRAAAAVPTLRSWFWWGHERWGGNSAETRLDAAVKLLHAIGPAARDALPDLRLWRFRTYDPAAVVRAIAAIEGE